MSKLPSSLSDIPKTKDVVVTPPTYAAIPNLPNEVMSIILMWLAAVGDVRDLVRALKVSERVEEG